MISHSKADALSILTWMAENGLKQLKWFLSQIASLVLGENSMQVNVFR